MKAKLLSMLCALTLFVVTSTTALAAGGPAVARVIVVQTDNAAAYVKEIEKGKAILKRLGSSGTIRVFRARFAGPETGSVVVTVEYPSFAEFASDDAKIAANAEYQTWLKGLDKLRKIVSDSVYQELSP